MSSLAAVNDAIGGPRCGIPGSCPCGPDADDGSAWGARQGVGSYRRAFGGGIHAGGNPIRAIAPPVDHRWMRRPNTVDDMQQT